MLARYSILLSDVPMLLMEAKLGPSQLHSIRMPQSTGIGSSIPLAQVVENPR